ncbi:MAG: UvrD-helicase domain-containing protein [Ignavibacteriales bacterium]|nr:UvrD-helicase domain-containing protein [Ignavibacteriales bacterium]
MSFLSELNSVQQEAVKTLNGPVMIIAGAGSGKTRVLTYRVAYLVSCGVPPYQILALTFTNKAANEMKERIVKLVGEKATDVWMGTFHSMFARVLRKEAPLLGFTHSFTIYDSDDSQRAVRRCMEKLNLSVQQIPAQAVCSRISGAKNQLVPPAEYSTLARDFLDEKIGLVYAEYVALLRRSNAMDFDDLLVKPIELFKKHPEVLKKYHHRFKFLLVDEFQDTNRAQYEVIKLLASGHENICVVGDDAQSIYAFRGADIRNILDFSKDYPEAKTFRLEQNYRSTKNILAVADTLIKFNLEQLKKDLWTENPAGEPVRLLSCIDDRDEGHQILSVIRSEIAAEQRALRDFAILYRTNAQSRSLEDVLRRNGVPYVIVGGIRFYERKEIKDVLAYLRLLVNPSDDESLLRAINYPARGIGDTSIEKLLEFAREKTLTLFESCERVSEVTGLQERVKKAIDQFRSFMKKYVSLRAKVSLSELARSMVDELGILRSYKEEGTAESMGRWENVQELLSAVTEFSDEHPDGTLEAFLEEVSLVADIDSWDETRNVITLMTLHASKGLEFPVVFVSGVEEGLLPFYSNTIERGELEEERRLFYVGITRAQTKLFLSKTQMRYRFGESAFASPSRFLSEIGEEKLEVVEGRSGPTSLLPGGRRGMAHHPRIVSERAPAREERFFADESPDYENDSQESFEIKQGTAVRHEMFGKGKVIRVTGKGDTMKAVVDFDDYGVKNLLVKFARLRPA